MAVLPGASPPPPGVPRHARTRLPQVVPFRQARCPIPRLKRDLPGTRREKRGGAKRREKRGAGRQKTQVFMAVLFATQSKQNEL